MWPFSLFKKKAKPQAEMGLVGQPVHVNVAPESTAAKLRHLSRISACIQSIPESSSKERIESLQAEIDRRRLLMAAAGIDVPRDVAGIEKLIAELKANG